MKLINRADAAKSGLKKYFTGKPCKHGHVAERYVATRGCCDCSAMHFQAHRDERVEYLKRYYQDNRQRLLLSQAAYNQKNAAARSSRMRDYYVENRDARRAAGKAWKSENSAAVAASNLRRIARKRRAVPVWFGELDHFMWQEAASLVLLRRSATGVDWAADHMLALAGRNVSGLHTWNNCQVIPALLNNQKKNNFALTQPGEWILCA